MYSSNVNIFRKLLSKFKEGISQRYRREVLSNLISTEISKLEKIDEKKTIKLLDYGSGYRPILIKKIIKKLSNKHNKTKFVAHCYDNYSNEQLKLINISPNIKFMHINKLSKKHKTKYNFCLIIDVLHHIGLEKNTKIYKKTKELKKISKFLIIKDHFQYGFFSNLTLILMDFVSNYGDGTKIPKIYFNINTFEKFISRLNLKEIKRITNKKYYKWFWFYLNNEKLQFISILR